MGNSIRCAGARSSQAEIANICHKTCDAFKSNEIADIDRPIGDIEDLFLEKSPLQSTCLKQENENNANSSPPTRAERVRVPERRLEHRDHRFLNGFKTHRSRTTGPSEASSLFGHVRSLELRVKEIEDAQIADGEDLKDLEVVPVGPRAKIFPTSIPGSAKEKNLVNTFWDQLAKNALRARISADSTQAPIVDTANAMTLNDDKTELRSSVQLHEIKGALKTEDAGLWSADVKALPNQTRMHTVGYDSSYHHGTEYTEAPQICAKPEDRLILADVGLGNRIPIASNQHIGQLKVDNAQPTITLTPGKSSMATTDKACDENIEALDEDVEDDEDDWWDEDDDPDMTPPPPPYYSLINASGSTASTLKPAFNPRLTDFNTLSSEENLETSTRPPSPELPPSEIVQKRKADAEDEETDDYEYSPAVIDWISAEEKPRRYTNFPDEFLSDSDLEAYYHSPYSSMPDGKPTRAQEVLVWRALSPARRNRRSIRKQHIPSPLKAEIESPISSTWQRARIEQLQCMDQTAAAKQCDGVEEETKDTEDISTEDDKELDQLVEIIMGRDVRGGSNKRRRLSSCS